MQERIVSVQPMQMQILPNGPWAKYYGNETPSIAYYEDGLPSSAVLTDPVIKATASGEVLISNEPKKRRKVII
jgi:hypothetical protein